MRRITTSIVLSICFFACTNMGDEQANSMIDSLKSEYQALKEQSNEKEKNINNMLEALNEIEDNLASIKEKEGILSSHTGLEEQLDKTQKDRIIEDIQLINTLMLENRQRINWLRQQLKKSGMKLDELNALIERLSKTIEEKDRQIADLREQLSNLQISMEELTMENETQKDVIARQTELINTAFYAFGTSKELKEKGIITKEGGFIGIGRIEKLREDFDKDYFTQIDITQTTSIDVFSKKARLITSHPKGSYAFTGQNQVDKLLIKDPQSFWSVSKYLVIVTD